jgi:hypothetical protein
VAQSIIESVRGQHEEFVSVWRRERVKNIDAEPLKPYRPVQAMNNTAWQNARKKAGLGDLHVHDLRHTVGMRLREVGVPEATIADILWPRKQSMTQHYSVAQIVEIHSALEKIRDDSGRWNKSLAMLRREQQEGRGEASPPKVPQPRKTGPHSAGKCRDVQPRVPQKSRRSTKLIFAVEGQNHTKPSRVHLSRQPGNRSSEKSRRVPQPKLT